MVADVKKIDSLEELKEIQEKVLKTNQRLGAELKEKVMVCYGGGCIASGSLKVKEAIENKINERGLQDTVEVIGTGCLGPCVKGPVVVMGRDKIFYQNVKVSDVDEIVDKDILGGEIIDRLTWKENGEETPIPILWDINFFKKQTKIVLRNCGKIDPLKIEDYIGCDGYQALGKVLTQMTPDEVISEMRKSNLRGRGGAGFPTWMKWSFAKKSYSDVKYILCNADEGDPGEIGRASCRERV